MSNSNPEANAVEAKNEAIRAKNEAKRAKNAEADAEIAATKAEEAKDAEENAKAAEKAKNAAEKAKNAAKNATEKTNTAEKAAKVAAAAENAKNAAETAANEAETAADEAEIAKKEAENAGFFFIKIATNNSLTEFQNNVIEKMKPKKCCWMICLAILTIAFACNFIFEKNIYKNLLVTEQTAIETNSTGTTSWESVTSEANQSSTETNTTGKNNSKSQHKTDKTNVYAKNLNVYKECIALYSVATLLLSFIIAIVFYVRKKMRIYHTANARFQILKCNVNLDMENYRMEDIQRELKAIASMVEDMQSKHGKPWLLFE